MGSVLVMPSDVMGTDYCFTHSYTVAGKKPTWRSSGTGWRDTPTALLAHPQTMHRRGSYFTVFKAEVSAILACTRRGLEESLVNRKVVIPSYRRTALLVVKE